MQSIEASIGLVTGSDAYQNSFSFYSEQLANPSLSSSHLLTARGVTRLLRGEVNEAKSDLEDKVKRLRKEANDSESDHIAQDGPEQSEEVSHSAAPSNNSSSSSSSRQTAAERRFQEIQRQRVSPS